MCVWGSAILAVPFGLQAPLAHSWGVRASPHEGSDSTAPGWRGHMDLPGGVQPPGELLLSVTWLPCPYRLVGTPVFLTKDLGLPTLPASRRGRLGVLAESPEASTDFLLEKNSRLEERGGGGAALGGARQLGHSHGQLGPGASDHIVGSKASPRARGLPEPESSCLDGCAPFPNGGGASSSMPVHSKRVPGPWTPLPKGAQISPSCSGEATNLALSLTPALLVLPRDPQGRCLTSLGPSLFLFSRSVVSDSL